MATINDDAVSPFAPLLAELARMRKSNLTAAIDDVDKIIDLLVNAREQVAFADSEAVRTIAITTLQNPVKNCLDKVTEDLKDVTKAQRGFGKALDKALPQRTLPMEADAMADHAALINRAIAMHLLREGQFNVASTFVRESRDTSGQVPDSWSPGSDGTDEDGDHDMTQEEEEQQTVDDDDVDIDVDANADADKGDGGRRDGDGSDIQDYTADLQGRFSEMYGILSELKDKNLTRAIAWARHNDAKLEANGSNLHFELSKLQFLWLFKGPAVNGLPDDEKNGQSGAFRYARQHFAQFQSRHLKEIQQLSCAMVYAPNIEQSPYRHIFEIGSAFEDMSTFFTREFCSLLGLSAESPLYIAVTAGSIALPRLIKYTTYMKEKRTEWSTENELAFETPLPPSMIYHPIFVCPISKDQTTEANPPMILPCGHVICLESLHNITKSQRYKCPYCPTEGLIKDAREITL